ncbi:MULTISPECIES: hypothetical protein [unclassified Paenibacillus]|uniref:hypothetical protein n=1 Tax=unclassified Paenibacillus TaxID=185978 RepID=UPI001AEAA257|nr:MULTISPECIES: hypothetical protein [unclassified Paenibacillus]MBP1154265.1 hypothetical protein [Paenibacillus sp. PvP091]MBP1170350.1 hypothetical protein [Paenibacillus sp. PvR098]MBP2441378.1 hypothetical protein [Paenibacillus sp. PvP052]
MFIDQIMPVLHYGISLLLLLVIVPWLFFRTPYHDGMEKIVSNVLKMSCIMMTLGYVLVILKLFELMSVAFLLIAIGNRIHIMRQKKAGMDDSLSNFETLIYDYFDGKYKLKQVLYDYASHMLKQMKETVSERFSSYDKLVGTCCLLGVLAFAGYLRFYDAFNHAAPSYGNRYTTLKWVKDVRDQLLFNDGILPQGFYVFWAGIQEFSRIDTLYMAEYTGPLSSILIMLGIYFFISRLTGSRFGGIVGVSLFALLGEYTDPLYWEWQAEADPRTFAYVFLLPTLYFLILYLRGRNRDAFQTMAAGMVVIALTDPVVFLLLLVGVCIIILTVIIMKRKKNSASVLEVLISWVAAAAISVVPIVIGFVMGKPFHPLFAQLFQVSPADPVMLNAGPSIFTLVVCVAAGFIWHYLVQSLGGFSYKKGLESAMLAALIATGVYFTSFQPVQPLKVDWDEAAAQYLTISEEYSPRSWMIVGKDSWASIVRGKGFHMNIHELVQNYDPSQASLTRNGTEYPDANIPSHVFIFHEKRLREINDDLTAGHLAFQYSRWDQELRDLQDWMDRYHVMNPKANIYYEDDRIVIYHFEQERNRKEIQKEIWGEG